MKPGRQSLIMQIIKEQDIETQNQLLDALSARGVKSTQATLSRDIRDMRLVKVLGANGVYVYAPAAKSEGNDLEIRLKKILKESVVSYESAQNLLVIKTLSGLASGAASALDAMKLDGLVGTIAGDDTALLVMKDNAAAIRLYHEIEQLF